MNGIRSFEEIREKDGLVTALNAYAAIDQIPEPKFPGEYHETLGLPGLSEDAEQQIKSKFSR